MDSALVRSGRIDYKLEFKAPTYEQVLEFYERFYPGSIRGAEFYTRYNSKLTCMAELQEILLRHRYSEDDLYTSNNVNLLASGASQCVQ